MFKRFYLLFFACTAILTPSLPAQVAQSATGGESHLWIGAGYARFASDWHGVGLVPVTYNLPGIDIYADLGVYRRFGLEGEAQLLNFTKPSGLTEKSLLIGPYMTVYRRGRLSASVKVLGGGGFVNYTTDTGGAYGSYFEFAPRGDIEYRFAHRLKARAGYEYQFMPSAPGAILPGFLSHGLTPSGVSIGVAYRVF